jgi:diadenosine tetraphosphate (Ap4A) HIT family hydrolase
MAEPFVLDPRLAADCALVGDLPLCRLLMMDDAGYPWCILVPRRAGVRELHELAATDRASLLDEVVRLSGAMQRLFAADKMNVAALGNVVPQLHVHVIARRRGDTAWPRPAWGAAPAVPYAAGARADLLARLREALAPLA